MEFVSNECGVSFNKNKSLLRHVRTVHQGMKRIDSEKRKADNEKRKSEKKRKAENRKSDRPSQEIAKIAKINNSAAEDTIPEESTPAEDIIPEECTVAEDKVSEDKPANTRYKYHLKTLPESVICFDFVGDSPETEDLKIMVEDCFEELIRACIIDRSLVIVESGSKKRYTEEELTDWMGNREVKLMQEGKTLGQHVFDYLGNSLDCFEIICLGPLSVRDVFKEAYNVKYNLV